MILLSHINCLLIINLFIFNKLARSSPIENLEIVDCNDEDQIMVIREGNKALTTVSYIPKEGCNITFLTEGIKIIWRASVDNEFVSLVKVHSSYNTYRLAYVSSSGDIRTNTRFYTREGFDWYEIHEDHFNQYLNWLKSLRIFDLKNYFSANWLFYQEHIVYGLKAHVFVPYPRFTVVEVCDGEVTLWERPNETDLCTSVIVHGDVYNPQMINIHLSINRIYVQKFFGKVGSEWKEFQKDEFYRILNDLDKKKESERRRSESNR